MSEPSVHGQNARSHFSADILPSHAASLSILDVRLPGFEHSGKLRVLLLERRLESMEGPIFPGVGGFYASFVERVEGACAGICCKVLGCEAHTCERLLVTGCCSSYRRWLEAGDEQQLGRVPAGYPAQALAIVLVMAIKAIIVMVVTAALHCCGICGVQVPLHA